MKEILKKPCFTNYTLITLSFENCTPIQGSTSARDFNVLK